MPKLPIIGAKKFVKFFEKRGFYKKPGRGKGSHIMMGKDGVARSLVFPDARELSIGVIRNNLKNAGISEADFIAEQRKSKKILPSDVSKGG